MTNIQTLLIGKVSKHLHWIEKFFLAVLLVGALLAVSGINATDIIFLSLSGLSVVYFLNAFRPPAEEQYPDGVQEPMGFGDLLSSLIIPKVLWISSSVATIGIVFFIADPANQGYKQMLIIGGGSIMVALVLLLFISIGRAKHLKNLQPALMRSLPIGVLAAYIFLK